MKSLCSFCLSESHLIQHCPDALRFIAIRTEEEPRERTTADDVNEALAIRMMGWKVVAGQLIRELREAGRDPSPATVALYPEPFDP